MQLFDIERLILFEKHECKLFYDNAAMRFREISGELI